MYNLSRKSLNIVVAGLSLLLFFSCKTTTEFQEIVIEKKPLTIQTLFPSERKKLIYVNSSDNKELMITLSDKIKLDRFTKKTLLDSKDIFLATNNDISDGFDLLLRGKISKAKAEFGLFLSFSWRKVNDGGYRYWQNRDGIKLYFVDNETLLVSSFDIKELINNNVEHHGYITPDNSMLLLVPELDEKDIQKLTMGFIRGGLGDLTLTMDSDNENYNIIIKVGVLDNRVRGFNQLLKLFVTGVLSKSPDPDIVNLSRDLTMRIEENSVILDNIVLKHGKIVGLLNNLLVINGEADK